MLLFPLAHMSAHDSRPSRPQCVLTLQRPTDVHPTGVTFRKGPKTNKLFPAGTADVITVIRSRSLLYAGLAAG